MDTRLRGREVLIVEDERTMAQLLESLLKGAGVQRVEIAANGDAAIQALKHWRPSVILLDYMLQDTDGIAVATRIRHSDEVSDRAIPILMLTAHAEPEVVYRARDAGVNEFLVKPVKPVTLVDRIEMMLGRPREFMETEEYVGPDRRRRKSRDPVLKRRAADFQTPTEPPTSKTWK
jgi:CheY-like chemotaxis protein